MHLFKDEKNQIMISNVWLKQVGYQKPKSHSSKILDRNEVPKQTKASMNRSGMTINFNGIQMNTEVSMYSTFQVNKYGFLISFCTISNHLYVVITLLIRLVCIFN